MSKVEERVERLESLLGQFIVNTDVALRRLETSLEPTFRRYSIMYKNFSFEKGWRIRIESY